MRDVARHDHRRVDGWKGGTHLSQPTFDLLQNNYILEREFRQLPEISPKKFPNWGRILRFTNPFPCP